MKAYGLIVPKKGRHAQTTYSCNTAEFIMENHDMSLVEHLVSGSSNRYRYRLHTSNAARYEDTLEYDIACPHCGNTLRLCGLPLDRHDHGLYKCPVCDMR